MEGPARKILSLLVLSYCYSDVKYPMRIVILRAAVFGVEVKDNCVGIFVG
jgi:hypothetical protein